MGCKRFAFVGTWVDFGGHGEGIYVFEIDPRTGDMRQCGHFTGYRNNSIIAVSGDGRHVYATIEDKNYKDQWGMGGGVLALDFDPVKGRLSVCSESSAFGACTSYICLDPEEQFVFVTNHGSGLDVVTQVIPDGHGGYAIERIYDDATLVMFGLEKNGGIGPVLDLHKHSGHGALNVRGQVCSHLHSVHVDPSGQWVLACDKGCDRIYVYRLDRKNRRMEMTPHTMFRCRPGSAPRHMEFHPSAPYVFVNHETASSVSAYRFDASDGTLTETDYQPMIDMDPDVPGEQIGDTYGSPADIHVHPEGHFLYSSQRSSYHTGNGTDGIAVFSVDINTGHIRRESFTALEGPCPRGFALDPEGRFLYVGNQYLDTITRFCVDSHTGALSHPVTVASAATPTCICIADVDI